MWNYMTVTTDVVTICNDCFMRSLNWYLLTMCFLSEHFILLFEWHVTSVYIKFNVTLLFYFFTTSTKSLSFVTLLCIDWVSFYFFCFEWRLWKISLKLTEWNDSAKTALHESLSSNKLKNNPLKKNVIMFTSTFPVYKSVLN